MTVLNDLDRFHLGMETIERLPQTGDRGISPKQQLKDKLIDTLSTSTDTARIFRRFRSWTWSG
jgi:xylulose-5-phosphate/fructose-6-phosphate phosphoketolase